MALKVTFFDKVKYLSTDFIARDADLFGSGVVHLTDFPITYSSPANMSISIGQGAAWINGYRVANDSNPITLTFAPADPNNPRIDIVEVGYSATTDSLGNTTGSPILQIKQGIPAANPIEPGADQNFIKLYSVSIAPGQTSITPANVTDRRSLVPINVDGSQIQNINAVQATYLNAIMSDMFGNTSVVLSGGVATKDATVPNQLDVTACTVYFGTGQRVSFPASQNGQFTTSTANATYYLDVNTDGTTSWGTSHSIKPGYVTICSVTTDANGKISTVTDMRPLVVNLFGSTDTVQFGGNVQAQKFIGDGSQVTNVAASKLATARTISLSGDVSGSTSFDGSGNSTLSTTLASVGTPGTYTKVTTDAKGRVVSGSQLSSSDVTTALGFTPANAANAALTNVSNTFTQPQTVNANVAINGNLSTTGSITTNGNNVLTDGDKTTRVFCHYNQSSPQSLSGAAWNTIQFPNKVQDNNNNFSSGTTFTAPKAGFYLFTASVMITSPMSLSVAWYVNGSISRRGGNYANAQNINVAAVIELNQGDTVVLQANPGSSTTTTGSFDGCWISIVQIG